MKRSQGIASKAEEIPKRPADEFESPKRTWPRGHCRAQLSKIGSSTSWEGVQLNVGLTPRIASRKTGSPYGLRNEIAAATSVKRKQRSLLRGEQTIISKGRRSTYDNQTIYSSP